MQVSIRIMTEQVRPYNGKDYVTVTGMEDSTTPLVQLLDYTLKEDEQQHRGKLVGKVIKVAVTEAPATFHGRLRLEGRILELVK